MRVQKKLFSYKKPYDLEHTNQLFLEAMRENCRYQYENCEDYARILNERGFHPDDSFVIPALINSKLLR